jgi:hypothetical protein
LPFKARNRSKQRRAKEMSERMGHCRDELLPGKSRSSQKRSN